MEWARLTVEERVEWFVGPLLEYVGVNTDVLAVLAATAPAGPKAPGAEELQALVLRAAERVVAACDSEVGRAERGARAAQFCTPVSPPPPHSAACSASSGGCWRRISRRRRKRSSSRAIDEPERRRLMHRVYTVFNARQIESIPPAEPTLSVDPIAVIVPAETR